MEYSISALSYVGPKFARTAQLPKEFGIEIFWDWGDEEYYNAFLPELLRERTGAFSIHGPTCISFAQKCEDRQLFEKLRRPFNLYHRFSSQFYVLHTHTNLPLAANITEEEIRSLRERQTARINRFDEICRAEGVQLVIENIGKSPSGVTMFDQQAFLDLFQQNQKLRCLLDLGHAVLGDYDIATTQQQLSSRLIAYHLHDNHGKADQHLRMGEGIIDWAAWKKNCLRYTPNAEIVFEYDGLPDAQVYIEDKDSIQK